MKTSQIGIDLIKHFEGLHDGDLHEIGLQPKMDPVGIWTEGYGRAMRDDKGNFIKGIANKKLAYSRITIHNEKQAEKALAEDLPPFESLVMANAKRPLKQNEFDALVSHRYNTGGSKTLAEMVNSQNPLLKAWWISHYITGQGNPKPLNGLIARRKAEAKLYFHD